MARKLLYLLTAILLLIAGSGFTWLLVSVPNDQQAEEMLRQAREEMKEGRSPAAVETLETVIRDYPRTDAAATATGILFRMNQQRIAALESQLAASEARQEELMLALRAMQRDVTRLASTPAPTPTPTPKPVVKKPPAKKAPAKKSSTRRRG